MVSAFGPVLGSESAAAQMTAKGMRSRAPQVAGRDRACPVRSKKAAIVPFSRTGQALSLHQDHNPDANEQVLRRRSPP